MNLDIAKTVHALLLPALRQNEYLRFEDASTTGMDVIRIIPHQDDMRLIIGKGGENIKALKTLAAECGRANNICVNLLASDNLTPQPQFMRKEWSLELIAAALNQLFTTLRIQTRCAIAEGRAGRSHVMLTGHLPEAILAPLERWLQVMAQGKTLLILDRDSVPTARAPQTPLVIAEDSDILNRAREILARQKA